MVAAIFGPDMFYVVLAIGLPVWAIADALSRPAPAFYGAGSNKTAWIMVLLVTTLIGIGLFLSAFYLIAVRPKVRRQTELLSRR